MLRSPGGSSGSNSPKKIFAGVRFVLFGFDSVSEAQYRSEIVRRGGVDVGGYDSTCTHVIVSGRVYDDPVCVAARDDGKMLVSELWVDDSVDFGKLADVTRVLYKPVKDLNGIPGSESLYICLTGYQRQERDDIMKMVSLMGARFSKPLIANQVTHLICYKFEGEKYELAKRVGIKLVNHRWLEDCLKAWEILPVDNYNKSSWEIEIMEAEAKDSEDEMEDEGTRVPGQTSNVGTAILRGGMPVSVGSDVPTLTTAKASIPQDYAVEKRVHSPVLMNNRFSTPFKGTISVKTSELGSLNSKVLQESSHQDVGCIAAAGDEDVTTEAVNGGELSIPRDANFKEGNALSSTRSTEMASTSSYVGDKCSSLSYSRKVSRKSVSPEKPSNNSSASAPGFLSENMLKPNFETSPSAVKEGRMDHKLADVDGPSFNAVMDHTETPGSALPHKRKIISSSIGSKSPKSECQSSKTCNPQSPLAAMRSAQTEPSSALPLDKHNPVEVAAISNSTAKENSVRSKFKSLGYKKKSLARGKHVLRTKVSGTTGPSDAKEAGLPSPRQVVDDSVPNNLPNLGSSDTSIKVPPADSKVLLNLPLEDEPHDAADAYVRVGKTANRFRSLAINSKITDDTSEGKMPEPSLGGLKETELATKSENDDTAMSDAPNAMTKEPVPPHKLQHDEELLSPNNCELETRKPLNIAKASSCTENNAKPVSGTRSKKAIAKRSMSRNSKLNAASDRKGILESKKAVNPTKAAVEAGEVGKVNVEPGLENATSDEMGGLVEPHCKDVVMEDMVAAAQHPIPGGSKENVTMDIRETSMDSEKENKPEHGSLASNLNNDKSQRAACKHGSSSKQSIKNVSSDSSKTQRSNGIRVFSSEPAWFILSGHRLQRKEFQMVIRCLKGRACRDSHNWSYQATHLIVPEPVRRTEKFFAAAAAGRWILKTEYLTASNEAGKFLEEEPYEWYRKGLTEDGAINLEAPRKWRLLRERTGHGAFYGMQIIIYGECIAPTLDTLKRVIKAGDGTILATSPPYTRFLKSGVDYAIVSPSMPRVDAWVQEFLRHEVPCVVADYLVEYVCKPGYSLERHVLYKTQPWAEKSFANLLSRSKEFVTDPTAPSEEMSEDLSCTVCGSHDRAEILLICGNEDGTIGCGVGTHIDCCDPPLEAVPEGDWFCPKCSKRKSKTPRSNKKKSPSKSR